MAFKYLASRNSFVLLGKPHDITEGQYGFTQGGFLNYPGVSTCTTITLQLDDGSLLGAHFAKADPAGTVDAILNRMNADRGARTVTQITVIGVLDAAGSGWKNEPRYAWRNAQLNTFKTLFGCTTLRGYHQPQNTDYDYRVFSANAVSTRPHASGPQGAWSNLALGAL